MALPSTAPAQVRANDDKISAALLVSEQSDSQLAAALWECSRNRYFRIFGFRSLSEYLRERWKDTAMSGAAALQARAVQRLLRDYKIATEIPLFRQEFDNISRTNRRLIAQVITLDNAAEWIDAAKMMTSMALERRVRDLPAEQAPDRPQRLYMSIPQSTRDLWERAKEAARKQEVNEGRDPEDLSDAGCLEVLCAEFIATYGG